MKKKKGVVSQQRDSFRDRTLISFNAAGSFSSSSSCPLSTWNSRLSTFDSISDSQPKKWVTLLSKLKWKIEIGIVGGGILKSEYNQGYLNSWVVSHLALVISKLCHALGHELSLGDYKLFFEPKLNIYALCRDHCILGQAFITLSPISDVFDNIEYFSALNKWFNFDIIEK